MRTTSLLTRLAWGFLATLILSAAPGQAEGDGVWDQLPPPSERQSHTAIHDPVRGRMLIFGGEDGYVPRNDVWALCLTGTPTWSALHPTGLLPSARGLHAATYDPVRDRMIVFGGHDGSGPLNEVWTLSLSGPAVWSQLDPLGISPSPRILHTMIYDPMRDRMIVFGGENGEFFNDVWALTLSGEPTWIELNPTGTQPSARGFHTATYDPEQDRMVSFGGFDPEEIHNDVWALSLSGMPAWTELEPNGAPPSERILHVAIQDPVRDRMIVFGGNQGNDTWALSLDDTLTWTELTPAGPLPSGRDGHAAIYDSAGDRLVVFGGEDGTRRNDVWALPLAGEPVWTQFDPSGAVPAERGYHSAIHDAASHSMVVFGGHDDSSGPLGDSWMLDLGDIPAWTALSPAGTPPPPRLAHAAIFDPLRDRMLVFGGVDNGGTRFNDVWRLSLDGPPTWSLHGTNGSPPSARGLHTAVHDPLRDRMLIFGGHDASGYRNDVWSLSLGGSQAWGALVPTGVPPSAREGSSAIYDPARDRMIVFGGFDGAVRDDVWALSLSGVPAWSPLLPTGVAPSAREGQTAIYDEVRDRMVIFGGEDGTNMKDDLWALSLADSSQWSALDPAGMLPPARYGHSAIHDPVRDRMVVFGGIRRNDVFMLDRGSLVAVDPQGPPVEARVTFAPPRPNPASAIVNFDFTIARASRASLRIFDGAGRLVRRLGDASYAAGRHVLVWDRRNEDGSVVPSGIYLVQLRCSEVYLTRKAILIQ